MIDVEKFPRVNTSNEQKGGRKWGMRKDIDL